MSIEINIKEQQRLIKLKIESEKVKAIGRRLKLDIPPMQFKELLIAHAQLILSKQNGEKFFDPKQAKDVLNQLYFYATQDDKFKGSFDKGILLIGKYGVGKTLVMEAFCNLIKNTTKKRINGFHSKALINLITKDPDKIYSEYSSYWLFIDDLGKEPHNVTSFGTQTMPMEDLLSARYDKRSITLATANLRIENFKYSESIKERMREMFNVIEFKGKSMRL